MRLVSFLMSFAVLPVCTVGAQRPAGGSSASSKSYLLVASETGPSSASATMQSGSYRAVGGICGGVGPDRAVASGYRLVGGFPASFDVSHAAVSWATAVSPALADIGTRSTHRILGSGLNLDAGARVYVDGVEARVDQRAANQLHVRLGGQTRPGWHDVQIRGVRSSTTVARAVGVRPLLEIERPFDDSGRNGSSVKFRGTRGDTVMWAIAAGSAAQPIRDPRYHWQIELDLASLIILAVQPVSATGKAELRLPAAAFVRPIHVQAIAFSTSASYAPGCFTNVARL